MAPVIPLFLIIFLEGYVVLSTELLAIRLLLPFTGSGTDTVSIIIAAILMPLAFGYYAGGRFGTGKGGTFIRRRLLRNLVIAALILTPGLSHAFLQWAFDVAYFDLGWTNRIWMTSVYSALFLVTPVFLLGQTVPLVSNYFSRERLSILAGRMLFFSTMGSFMGAVFCTLVLMTFAGVHHTVTATIGCMAVLAFILARKKLSLPPVLIALCLIASLILNSGWMMAKFDIIKNNKYNMIQIEEHPEQDARIMLLNGTYASAVRYTDDSPRLHYAQYIEQMFLTPVANKTDEPKRKILILGAGGFTLGRTDEWNDFTYVDIDKDLKDVSEQKLLQEDLTPNKIFVPMEARAFLNQTKEKYDLIMLDLYRDPISAPEYLVTKEFYEQVRDHLNEGGIVAGNYFASPTFSDPFSVRLDNTFRSVFPNANRAPVLYFNGWERKNDWQNIIYSSVYYADAPREIYTDNKSSVVFDKPATLPKRKKH